MRFILLLLSLLIVTRNALADILPYPPKHFSVKLICGGGVDCQRAQAAFRRTANYYKTLNVYLDLQSTYVIHEEMSGDSLIQLLKWAVRTSTLPQTDATIIALASYSPLADHVNIDAENTLGRASGIGILGKQPCGAFVRIVGSTKLASKVMAHEVGHLLGATHTQAGIMQPGMDVGQYADGLSEDSVNQIEQYLVSLPH